MKKVFILYNWDVNEIIAVSEDRDLLRELMCDYFLSDAYYQWYWEQMNPKVPLDPEVLPRKAKEVWIDIFEWYEDYMEIMEEEVIS